MRSFAELSRRSRWLGLSALALMTAVAGCSSESSRFAENPYASPYSSKDSTGSVARAPAGKVEAQPLPQPQAQPLPPPHRPATVSSVGSSGGSAGMGSYQQGPSYQPGPASYAAPAGGDVTGSVATPPRPAPVATTAASKWDWNGGTAIIVGPGETVQTLSNKYGVPISAIMEANNLSGLSLKPGQRVIIPRYNAAGTVAPASQPARPAPAIVSGGAPATVPAATAPKGAHVHVIAPGETLMSLSRRYHKPVGSIATANHIPPTTMVKVGDRIVVPGVAAHSAKAITTPASPPAPQPKLASVEPPQTARMATPEPAAQAEAPVT